MGGPWRDPKVIAKERADKKIATAVKNAEKKILEKMPEVMDKNQVRLELKRIRQRRAAKKVALAVGKLPSIARVDYDPAMPQMVMDYIAQCNDSAQKVVSMESLKSETTTWQHSTKVELPSMAGLALYLGCTKSRLDTWSDAYPEFEMALDQLRHAQENRLLQGGLGGKYAASIAKLILSTHHGYKETIDNKHTVTTVNMAMDWGDGPGSGNPQNPKLIN